MKYEYKRVNETIKAIEFDDWYKKFGDQWKILEYKEVEVDTGYINITMLLEKTTYNNPYGGY